MCQVQLGKQQRFSRSVPTIYMGILYPPPLELLNCFLINSASMASGEGWRGILGARYQRTTKFT